jgi:6-phospho-3-hexuloisomerase
MKRKGLAVDFAREVGVVLERIPAGAAATLGRAVRRARRVYLLGRGRTGLIAETFGVRLAQMGIETHLAGSPMATAIGRGDLLLACSSTGWGAEWARLARRRGARVAALVGARARFPRGADPRIRIDAVARRGGPPLLLGSLFEQALLLFLDAVAAWLMEDLGLTEAHLWRRHTDSGGK